MFCKLAPVNGGQRETEETDHSRLIDVRFNKQGDLLRIVLGGHKTWGSSNILPRILKVYTEALTGFSHIYCPHGLNNLFSQGCILETAPTIELLGRTCIPRTWGRKKEPFIEWVQVLGQLKIMYFSLPSLTPTLKPCQWVGKAEIFK